MCHKTGSFELDVCELVIKELSVSLFIHNSFPDSSLLSAVLFRKIKKKRLANHGGGGGGGGLHLLI